MHTAAMTFYCFYRQCGEGTKDGVYQGGDTLNGTIGTVLFADDMVMMAETREALLHNVGLMNAAH